MKRKGLLSGEKKGLLHELRTLWPALPYLSFGVWLAWAALTYSGTLWLSDVEVDGTNLSMLYIASTASFALVCLLATFCLPLFKRLLASRYLVLGMGSLAGVGALFIIAAGPYYLLPVSEVLSFALFWSGAAFTGVGTAVVGLKVSELYGALAPRRVLLYTALSLLTIAFIYFAVIASPPWAPVAGGPSLVGICAFCLLPLFAALLAVMPTPSCSPVSQSPQALSVQQADQAAGATDVPANREGFKALPSGFWRLLALTFLLSFAASMMRGAIVEQHTLATTLEGSNFLMLLRIPLALALIFAAVRLDARHMNFGKLFSLIAVILVAMIAGASAFGQLNLEISILVYFCSGVLEVVMWCLLAFLVFQKRVSFILVFGFGRGIFMLGCALGWWFGAHALHLILNASSNFAFYVICAAVVLVLSFALFSERVFERLFSPINEHELSLEELMEPDLVEESAESAAGKNKHEKGRFSQCIEQLGKANKLSARETEVFKYLAMGHGSELIAKKLQVSWNTVRTHTHNVYVKLGVHSRHELMELIDAALEG